MWITRTVEPKISEKREHWHVRRDHQFRVNGSKAPVQYTNQNLDWGGDQREVVLDSEESVRVCYVG
jgi:hypothetical protein